MSMLTAQIDELRLMGDGQAAKGEFAVATLLREAADTIESMQDSLNEVAGRWAEAQIKAEDYSLENMLLKIDNDTRWYELFGTPERAARTLARMCFMSDGSCAGCPMFKYDIAHCKSDYSNLGSIVEWLESEVRDD